MQNEELRMQNAENILQYGTNRRVIANKWVKQGVRIWLQNVDRSAILTPKLGVTLQFSILNSQCYIILAASRHKATRGEAQPCPVPGVHEEGGDQLSLLIEHTIFLRWAGVLVNYTIAACPRTRRKADYE